MTKHCYVICRASRSAPSAASPSATISGRLTGLTAATSPGVSRDFSQHPHTTHGTDAPSKALTASSTSYTPRTGTPPLPPPPKGGSVGGSRGGLSQQSHASHASYQSHSPPIYLPTVSRSSFSQLPPLSGSPAQGGLVGAMKPPLDRQLSVSPTPSVPPLQCHSSHYSTHSTPEPRVPIAFQRHNSHGSAQQRQHMHVSHAIGDFADSSAIITPVATDSTMQLQREYGSPGDHVRASLQPPPKPPQPNLMHGAIAASGDVTHSEFSSPHWPSHSLQSLPSPFDPPAASSQPVAAQPVATSSDNASSAQHTAQHAPRDTSNLPTDSVSPQQPVNSILTVFSCSNMAAETSYPGTSCIVATSASDPFISQPVLQIGTTPPLSGPPARVTGTQYPSSHPASEGTPVATPEQVMVRNSSTATRTSVATGVSSIFNTMPSSWDGGAESQGAGDVNQVLVPRSNNTSPGNVSPSHPISNVSSGSFRKVSEARGITGTVLPLSMSFCSTLACWFTTEKAKQNNSPCCC